MNRNATAIVIGAGAAGMMAASVAGKNGNSVIILEKNKSAGRKIQISGGGRCNFTNRDATPAEYVSQNPHFPKSALKRYSSWDFIDLVERYEVPYHEKKLGQLFCNDSSKRIINLLINECNQSNVQFEYNTSVESVRKLDDEYIIRTDKGEFRCKNLIVASGGLSIPTIGATDIGMRIAKQFGHKLIETRPALVPFTLSYESFPGFKELAGVSLDCLVSNSRASFRENILFTHKGLSGPAILQISLHWKKDELITINFLPEKSALDILMKEKKRGANKSIKNILKAYLPERFLEVFLENFCSFKDEDLSNIKNESLEELAAKLNSFSITPSGTEGYRKAEVTSGGVCTSKVSSKTMESQLSSGLYFIGEVLDVTGWLGGYNFQWAWASAQAAGHSIQ